MTPEQRRVGDGVVRVVDRGEGPAVVLLHGLGGTWRNWETNIAVLAERYRVIVPDLPGFGGSQRYAGAVTVQRYADTIVDLLDVLGVDSATFVGNSMGGMLTIETAVRHPSRVRAAVLVASGGMPLTSRRHRLLTIPQAQAFSLLMRLSVARHVVRTNARVRHAIAREIVHDPAAIPQELLVNALRGLGAPGFGAALDAGRRYDARVRAARVACPTLLLWGRDDRLLPVAMGGDLQRLIPDSRLEVWDDTGHCPMLEHPRRFEALVDTFVAGVHARLPHHTDDRRSA